MQIVELSMPTASDLTHHRQSLSMRPKMTGPSCRTKGWCHSSQKPWSLWTKKSHCSASPVKPNDWKRPINQVGHLLNLFTELNHTYLGYPMTWPQTLEVALTGFLAFLLNAYCILCKGFSFELTKALPASKTSTPCWRSKLCSTTSPGDNMQTRP